MAYIAAMEGGIQEVDCRTPLQPVPGVQYRHHDGAGDQITRLLADQQHLYAIDSQRGLQLLTRPGPGQLRLQGSFVAPEGALWALTMRWPYLFVTTVLHSLYVLDVTTPAQPRLLSTTPYGGRTSMTPARRCIWRCEAGAESPVVCVWSMPSPPCHTIWCRTCRRVVW